jgi:hypothetical protein
MHLNPYKVFEGRLMWLLFQHMLLHFLSQDSRDSIGNRQKLHSVFVMACFFCFHSSMAITFENLSAMRTVAREIGVVLCERDLHHCNSFPG